LTFFLVLLIIFMVMPHLRPDFKSDLPQPPLENQPPAPPDPQNLVLTNFRKRLHRDQFPASPSGPTLGAPANLFAVRPDGVLFVDGAKELQFEDVAHGNHIAKSVGVTRIGLLTAKK